MCGVDRTFIGSYKVLIPLDFSLTVKAAPHDCEIRTSQS